jgi:hypothetical protein
MLGYKRPVDVPFDNNSGNVVVDMHGWYRNRKFEEQGQEASGQSISNGLLAIWKFSNQLCVNLERKLMMGRASAQSLSHMVTHGQNKHEALERK